MPVLQGIQRELRGSTPFAGVRIGICLHVEPKTAVLCSALQSLGAEVSITGSPGTTKDDVADALREDGIRVYTKSDDDAAAHARNIESVLSHEPNVLLDNGADLAALTIARGSSLLGGTEETTTGANRLREELGPHVTFPVIVINDSPLKSIVENQHGVGQTIVEGFMRVTNLLIPARPIVVIGHGWCGRGVARYFKSYGGKVFVVDTDAIHALEAALDGMDVVSLEEALALGEVFVTVTGRPGILRREHFDQMKDGAILANAGHFSWEIELDALHEWGQKRAVRSGIDCFEHTSGRKLYLLTDGEMLNLAGGGGNPIETMDLGLSLQLLSLLRVAQSHEALSAGAQPVPADINDDVARRMLSALGRRGNGQL